MLFQHSAHLIQGPQDRSMFIEVALAVPALHCDQVCILSREVLCRMFA